LTNHIDRIFVIQNSIDGGCGMQTVTVSPKYQVVIPKAVREALHLRPGQKMQIVEYDGRIELIPERDIRELRGFLKGINTEFEREEDRV
jgi:AbrB family looped-hinge helix DNA binding protein